MWLLHAIMMILLITTQERESTDFSLMLGAIKSSLWNFAFSDSVLIHNAMDERRLLLRVPMTSLGLRLHIHMISIGLISNKPTFSLVLGAHILCPLFSACSGKFARFSHCVLVIACSSLEIVPYQVAYLTPIYSMNTFCACTWYGVENMCRILISSYKFAGHSHNFQPKSM